MLPESQDRQVSQDLPDLSELLVRKGYRALLVKPGHRVQLDQLVRRAYRESRGLLELQALQVQLALQVQSA